MDKNSSLKSQYPILASQWDVEKNGDLTPDMVTTGSRKKVWWRCEKGHSWQALIVSRVSGCGCPICINRTVLPGYNDLATKNPSLAAQWHPFKNGDLTAEQVGTGYDKRVWWRCEHGHEWQATVNSRANHSAGCPICSNYMALSGYNDLEALFPEIAAQWHPTKNGILKPSDVVGGSNRNVWWQCHLGHEWRAKIVDRTRGTNKCPYCTNRKVLAGYNDLATTHPNIAAQWHPKLNGSLAPQEVTAGSARRIWWICPEGHVWRTAVYNRAGTVKQTGCPICTGNYKGKYRQEPHFRALNKQDTSGGDIQKL